MRNLNFLFSNFGQDESNLTSTCLRYASDTPAVCLWHLFRKVLILSMLLFTIGVGNVWGATYTLVTNTNQLSAGDEIIIVNTGGTKAMSTTQNSNNRGSVTVSVSNNKISDVTNLQVITLGTAKKNSTTYWTLQPSSGNYLYAASSSNNYLKTKSTLADECKWSITLNASYEATITSQGTYTRNIIRNNGELFSCYASGQTAVKIYKKMSGYSITYHCNGATSGCPSNASSQTAMPDPLPTPTRTGCTFAGWYTNEGLTSAATAGATLAADADLYAKWTCNVTLNRNGATETINNKVVGTALDDIDGTSAQGGCSEWTFEGWSKTQRAAQNNSTAMDLVTTVDGPGPYYAVYSHTESGGSSSSGNETITLSDGSFTTDHIDWSGSSCTVSQTQGSSSTAVNSNYVSAPRVYKGHILSFVANTNYTITKIEITVNGTYYGNSMTAGTAISGTTVTNNTTDVGRTWASTSGGTHEITSVDDDGLSAIYIQNVASADNVQLRPTGIKVYYIVSGGSTTYYSTTASCCTQLGSINGSVLQSKGKTSQTHPNKSQTQDCSRVWQNQKYAWDYKRTIVGGCWRVSHISTTYTVSPSTR